MPGARWFPGATLNYAEHVLRAPGRADDDVIVSAYSQTREPVTSPRPSSPSGCGGRGAALRSWA